MSFGYTVQNAKNYRVNAAQFPTNETAQDAMVHNWAFNSVYTKDLFVDNCTLHLGTNAGGPFPYDTPQSSSTGSIAIGCHAGEINQGHNSVSDLSIVDQRGAIAIGTLSGQMEQSSECVSVGFRAGNTSQGVSNIYTTGSLCSIAIGTKSGEFEQHAHSISMGYMSANGSQLEDAVSIGTRAGMTGQGQDSLAILRESGQISQGQECIAIGVQAGQFIQRTQSISAGTRAGQVHQQQGAIAIGFESGQQEQQLFSVALGYQAGNQNLGVNSLVCGTQAGFTNCSEQSVCVGYRSAYTNCGQLVVSLGSEAAYQNASQNVIAIGQQAAYQNANPYCIAIGYQAGYQNQGISELPIGKSIAIGFQAGMISQGDSSVAIGNSAGVNNQADNSIILNASATTLDAPTTGLFIKPINQRDTDESYYTIHYRPSTSEVVYGLSNNSTPGIVQMFAGSSAPHGFLLCDGSSYNTTDYPNLFNVIGYTYGGDGEAGTFQVPNMKGRVPVGLDASQGYSNALGVQGGEQTHTLTINEMPAHSHTIHAYDAGSTGGSVGRNVSGLGERTPSTDSQGGSQPYLVLNYIISY